LALQAHIPTKTGVRRPKKPKAIKLLEQGPEEYARKQAAKKLGKIISKEHTMYQLSFGMMLGIYTSCVSSQLGAEKLNLIDFMKVRKLNFPPAGSLQTPPHALPKAFKFKDYAPKAFYHLRERFAIDESHYLNSLGGAYEYIEFNSNSKSGSFFFYSHDGKFMIKTQSKKESKLLRRILAHYYQYVMEHPHTYITRFYGLHRIKMPHIRRKIHFVVMQSVFYGQHTIHEMYDLKGSSVGRAATEREALRGPSSCVYKDNDLVDAGVSIHLGPARREAFIAQLTEDASFLQAMKIMDYSLLLGIHYRSQKNVTLTHALATSTSGRMVQANPLLLATEGEHQKLEPIQEAPPKATATSAAASAGANSASSAAGVGLMSSSSSTTPQYSALEIGRAHV
jgi:1-phosphatidylinositol-4-phosphate 5-kinase